MRPDASMNLLTDVMERALDPGYAAAAREPARRGPGRTIVVAVLAICLGLLTATAAQSLRGPRPAQAAARTLLVDQITRRQAMADGAGSTVDDLTRQITRLREQAGSDRTQELLTRARSDAVDTGAVAVRGPGLLVTVAEGQALVLDADLQDVVNALWSGGAEAIAINGHRLTSTSAIRTAGDAILVDLEPMVSPYQISAIGDADAMQVAMVRTGTSDHLRLLGSQFGIHSSVTAQSSLTLPGSGDTTLYYAHSTKDP